MQLITVLTLISVMGAVVYYFGKMNERELNQ